MWLVACFGECDSQLQVNLDGQIHREFFLELINYSKPRLSCWRESFCTIFTRLHLGRCVEACSNTETLMGKQHPSISSNAQAHLRFTLVQMSLYIIWWRIIEAPETLLFAPGKILGIRPKCWKWGSVHPRTPQHKWLTVITGTRTLSHQHF